jgi:hypothetical protein
MFLVNFIIGLLKVVLYIIGKVCNIITFLCIFITLGNIKLASSGREE